MILRRAGLDDARPLADLEAEVFSDPWSLPQVERELRLRAARAWVLVTEEGTVVAYATYRVVPEEGELLRIAVTQEARGQGHGKALLLGTLDELAGEGVRSLHLDVRRDNCAARRLYETVGFERTGLRRRYYRDGMDAVSYGKGS